MQDEKQTVNDPEQELPEAELDEVVGGVNKNPVAKPKLEPVRPATHLMEEEGIFYY